MALIDINIREGPQFFFSSKLQTLREILLTSRIFSVGRGFVIYHVKRTTMSRELVVMLDMIIHQNI